MAVELKPGDLVYAVETNDWCAIEVATVRVGSTRVVRCTSCFIYVDEARIFNYRRRYTHADAAQLPRTRREALLRFLTGEKKRLLSHTQKVERATRHLVLARELLREEV